MELHSLSAAARTIITITTRITQTNVITIITTSITNVVGIITSNRVNAFTVAVGQRGCRQTDTRKKHQKPGFDLFAAVLVVTIRIDTLHVKHPARCLMYVFTMHTTKEWSQTAPRLLACLADATALHKTYAPCSLAVHLVCVSGTQKTMLCSLSSTRTVAFPSPPSPSPPSTTTTTASATRNSSATLPGFGNLGGSRRYR